MQMNASISVKMGVNLENTLLDSTQPTLEYDFFKRLRENTESY